MYKNDSNGRPSPRNQNTACQKSLQTTKSAVSCHNSKHHCNNVMTKLTYNRKETLYTFARKCEDAYDVDMEAPAAQKILHTKFGQSAMESYEPNMLLHSIPSISPEEADTDEEGLTRKKEFSWLKWGPVTVHCDETSKMESTAKNHTSVENSRENEKQQHILSNALKRSTRGSLA